MRLRRTCVLFGDLSMRGSTVRGAECSRFSAAVADGERVGPLSLLGTSGVGSKKDAFRAINLCVVVGGGRRKRRTKKKKSFSRVRACHERNVCTRPTLKRLFAGRIACCACSASPLEKLLRRKKFFRFFSFGFLTVILFHFRPLLIYFRLCPRNRT